MEKWIIGYDPGSSDGDESCFIISRYERNENGPYTKIVVALKGEEADAIQSFLASERLRIIEDCVKRLEKNQILTYVGKEEKLTEHGKGELKGVQEAITALNKMKDV